MMRKYACMHPRLFPPFRRVCFLFCLSCLEGSVDYLIKGDVMELLVKLLNEYCQNYLITGYSLYSLYQLAQRGGCFIDTMKCR